MHLQVTHYIWAWTYSENVEVDESITIIGNATSNTTLNITSGKGFRFPQMMFQ